MVIGNYNKQINLKIINEKLDKTHTYKYLGVQIQKEGNMEGGNQ